jgi:hypothetical protein
MITRQLKWRKLDPTGRIFGGKGGAELCFGKIIIRRQAMSPRRSTTIGRKHLFAGGLSENLRVSMAES